jgi:hypothetical protein
MFHKHELSIDWSVESILNTNSSVSFWIWFKNYLQKQLFCFILKAKGLLDRWVGILENSDEFSDENIILSFLLLFMIKWNVNGRVFQSQSTRPTLCLDNWVKEFSPIRHVFRVLFSRKLLFKKEGLA